MVFRVQNVLTTDRLREIVRANDADFPHTALESDLTLFEGRCSPWHWHDYFEFGVVEAGRMELQTRDSHASLEAGDAYFVNAGVLHLCKAADDASFVRLHVHLFDRSLVASNGLVMRRYLQPIENAAGFEAMTFTPLDASELIGVLREAYSLADGNESGWEMGVSGRLTEAWRMLYRLAAPGLRFGDGESREDTLRAKAMLSFIHDHYDQPITVDQIAASAGICERECFRCFARVLDTTPKAYLTKYRVGIAARLLSETNDSITDIAYRCGFANSSYFGKVFHRMLSLTPRDFRKGK